MESIVLLAIIGVLSTTALIVLSISRKLRPYCLTVLGASVYVALSVRDQAIGYERNLLEAWPTYLYIMFGVQVLGAPVALIAFIFFGRRQRSKEQVPSKGEPNWPT